MAGTTCEETEEAPPPYRGLARYETDDQELFCGRDRMVEQLGKLACEHRLAVLCWSRGPCRTRWPRSSGRPRARTVRRRAAAAARRVLLHRR
ncbi:nSTAND1 domain-containing NTPase [Streptomyces europaeiscabiei]|uniref:nSTAND1 domain-containing NTPase n=1 Tax=Streptomyces europaeiscabiei TaxID=146819 RepID=UPI0038D45C3A